ncbi:hypothetical protein [Massilia sp. 9I]|uniref:hypothetical protein n=1 Tax=Massilia sp. 9I TaxID=2653152 RepID=UPI0012F22015|nr:hypothetical protein [Massilia sp. 9I]VXC67330.1 conserved exported hypothetical protein [Massilia sp. 9I]
MKMIAAACFALALAGCATQEVGPGPTEQELVASAGNTAGQDGHQMTGSRIKDRTSTDRMLKAVGAQGAKDEMANAPRPLSSQ